MRGEASAQEREHWLTAAHQATGAELIAGIERDCLASDLTLLTPAEVQWPAQLRVLEDPPALLWCRGATEMLECPQLAVVGARRASARALADVSWLIPDLVDAGLAITSGLAAGIDGRAHEATLAAGGRTLAVLGSGLDRIYPRRHGALAERIARDGLLISEFPPGAPPRAHHFPRRNRIISGLALGVLVVEAGERSGSMITARLAAAQGRDVFALPSWPRDLGAAGALRLLREGAVLVRHADDILEELGLLHGIPRDRSAPLQTAAVSAALKPVHDALDVQGTDFDALRMRTGLDSATLASRLTELELDGLAVREGERWVPLPPAATGGAARPSP